MLIAAGSNATSRWGDPAETLHKAFEMVRDTFDGTVTTSRFFNTPAFPAGVGPDFVNAAAVVTTSLAPQAVLDHLHRIEAQADRNRDVRWGQRTLDLDLIAAGDLVMPDKPTYESWRNLALVDQMKQVPDQLILPHPRMHDRAFVLVPLADVAPDWRHPVTGLTVAQMRDACDPADLAGIIAQL